MSGGGSRREQLIAAFELAEQLRDADANEATTRIRLIDQVLRALGWSLGAIDFEAPSGGGDFLDYLLKWAGEPWVVVEAKRAGTTFQIDPAAFRSDRSHVRAIKGLMNKGGESLRAAMLQAARYANDRAVPFCAVTSGHQWLFFRGLSTQSAPWTEGRALVFLTPDEVLSRMDDFVDCLGHDGRRSQVPTLLEQPTVTELPEPVVPAEVLRFRRKTSDDDLGAQIAVVSSYMLADIHSDDRLDMLDRCYVSPNLASDFDTSIRRLLRDSSEYLENEGSEVVEGDVDDFTKAVTMRERVALKHPVVVVGHIGAGKTTFLHSAFRKMKVDRLAFPAIVDLEGLGRGGTFNAEDEHRKAAGRILEGLQRATKGVLRKRDDLDDGAQAQGDPFNVTTLRTLCRKKLDDARELAHDHWATHEADWLHYVLGVVDEYRKDTVPWLIHFLRHLRARFTRRDESKSPYPILLAIDNIDQADTEYQKCIYGLAQQIARDTRAIVVFCIREDTYREGRHPKGFLSSTPLSFVFHVKSPGLDHVLRSRLDFATAHLLNTDRLGEASAALPEWSSRLQRSLLADAQAGAELIGALAGQNTRSALDMAGRVIASGVDPEAAGGASAGVLEGLLSMSAPHTVAERVGLGNVFDADPAVPVTHALRLRLLAYLHGTSKLAHARQSEEQTDVVAARFAIWGYRTVLVRAALQGLLASGLICDAQNRALAAPDGLPKRIGLTAAGYVHLTRLSREGHYRLLMACAGRWYDPELAQRFIERCQDSGNDDGCTFGDIWETTALSIFDAYLKASYEAENRQLADLGDHRWVRDVLSLTAGPFGAAHVRSPTTKTAAAKPTRLPSAKDGGGSPSLFPTLTCLSVPELPRLSRTLKARGTAFVPRILWALEWGRLAGIDPMSPKDMSNALSAHAEIDIAHNNISRAFREMKAKPSDAPLWRVVGKRYCIEPSGSALLHSLLTPEVKS